MGKLISADIGSFNIKMGEGIYENRYVKDNLRDTFGANTLTYDGNTYFFGQGTFNKEGLKTNKDMLIPLLYGLGRQKVSGNINIILHLPPREFARKDKLIGELQGKTFSYQVNGFKSSVTLDKVGILKEGFSSFYSLSRRNDGMIAIIDIGGTTSELFTFIDGVQVSEDSCMYGTIKYFDEIATGLVSKGQNRTVEDIHNLIAKGIIDLKDFEEITDKYYNEIINAFKPKCPNLSDFKIKLCGGGSVYFEKNFKHEFKNVKRLEKSISSNIDGAEKIGKSKGLDK